MLGLSSIAILDKKGKSLLTRNYKKDNIGAVIEEMNHKLLDYDPEN